MKKILYIFIAIFLIGVSCEKPVDKGEFGNPLLRLYGEAKEDIGYSVAETSDGYIICGKLTIIERDVNEAGASIIVGENPNFGLIKTDRNGIQQWIYSAGGTGFDTGRKVIVLDDGSFVCVGTTTIITGESSNKDVLVTKISSGGELVWEYSYGNDFNQAGYDILEDQASGGFFVVGSDDDYTIGTNIPGNRDMYMFTINSDGTLIQSYSTGSPEDEFAESVVYTSGGTYIIAGTTNESQTDTPGQAGLNIMTYPAEFDNFSGKDYKIYGGPDDELVSEVVKLDQGFAIVGTRNFGTDSKEGLFTKIESDILPLTVSFSSFDLSSNVVTINSLLRIPGEGFLASGNTGGTDLSGDMLFMFLDQNGNNVSVPPTYISGGTGLQSANDAIIDSDGKIVAVGINMYENNSFIALLKFDPWE